MSKAGDDRFGRHHYVPELHLKYWADTKGKIRVWRRVMPSGKLVFSTKDPSAVGYRHGLYALRGAAPSSSQIIENQVFANFVEDHAGRILAKMNEPEIPRFSLDERRMWAVYLNSSLIRLPHVLEKLDSFFTDRVRKELLADQEVFKQLKGDSSEENLLDWAMVNCPQELVNLDLEAMLHLLTQDEILKRILDLKWRFVDFSQCDDLLLGDVPLLRFGNLFSAEALLVMPLSPKRSFIGVADEAAYEKLYLAKSDDLVRNFNIATLSTAREFVIGNAPTATMDAYFRGLA